jgi:hypothetical protein
MKHIAEDFEWAVRVGNVLSWMLVTSFTLVIISAFYLTISALKDTNPHPPEPEVIIHKKRQNTDNK